MTGGGDQAGRWWRAEVAGVGGGEGAGVCRVEFSPFTLLIVSAVSPCPAPPASQQHHIRHPALRPPAPLSGNWSFLLRGGLWPVCSPAASFS